MKVAIFFLALLVSAFACPHDGYSTDIADIAADCDPATIGVCRTTNDCEHGQQCCFERDGCASVCYHPDPIHTTHPAP